MTPQLKYGLISLFILLDLCVLVYLFSGNSPPPAKQAAAPPPSTQPAVQQLPPQNPVPQPPVQQLPPRPSPPPPNPYEIEKDKCNSMAATFKDQFLNHWPQYLTMFRSNDEPSGRTQQEYFAYRNSWIEAKQKCMQSVLGWTPPFEHTVVELAIKEDCDVRARNYRARFMDMAPLSMSERERYLSTNGEPPFFSFVSNFQALKQKCSRVVTGWVGYDEQEVLRQGQYRR